MLVELERYHQELNEEGDELPPTMTAINPAFVSAIMPSRDHDDCTIVRGPDGRGFLVRGHYRDVLTKLRTEEHHHQ